MLSKLDKVYHEGDRVYLPPGEEPPPGVHVEQGPRGGQFFRWQPGAGHGGWERRRRTARREARLAQAQVPAAGSVVSTSSGPARVEEMLPSGGAIVETRRGPARLGPDKLSDAAKRSQLEQLVDSGDLPRTPAEVMELYSTNPKLLGRVMEAVYSTPGYPVKVNSLEQNTYGHISVMASVLDETGAHVAMLNRLLYTDGSRKVYHALFEMDSGFQGGGLAARMNRQAEMAYLAMGYNKVTLNADIDVGKYAWARQGYDFNSRVSAANMKGQLVRFLVERAGMREERAVVKVETSLGNDFHTWDVAALDDGEEYDSGEKGTFPMGKAFMLSDFCTSWDGTKRITPGHLCQRVGEAYLNASDARPRPRRLAAGGPGKKAPFILPREYADLGGDDSSHWDVDERTDAAWRARLGRMKRK